MSSSKNFEFASEFGFDLSFDLAKLLFESELFVWSASFYEKFQMVLFWFESVFD